MQAILGYETEVTIVEENVYRWLEDVLKEEFIFIKSLKKSENYEIKVYENRKNYKRIIVKCFVGNPLVYKKLLCVLHPNIPTVYEVAELGDKCIVIEEYIDGITVGEVLEIGRYTRSGVKKVITQLCNALAVIHSQGIVHRDIKPENIMVDKNGIVKLIDFNISRLIKENKDKDTVMLGTTGFASPEQYGMAETDARSDIYSIGILINVMLTGEHPSKKMCRGRWQRIVNKCTRINPEERYQNVTELIRSIR